MYNLCLNCKFDTFEGDKEANIAYNLMLFCYLIYVFAIMYVYFPLKNQHIILQKLIRKIVVMSFYMHKLHTQKGEL